VGVDGGADHLRSLLSVKETLSARHTRHHIIEMYWQNRIGKHNVSDRKRIELECIFFITNYMLRSISRQANCIFTHSLAEVDGVRNK